MRWQLPVFSPSAHFRLQVKAALRFIKHNEVHQALGTAEEMTPSLELRGNSCLTVNGRWNTERNSDVHTDQTWHSLKLWQIPPSDLSGCDSVVSFLKASYSSQRKLVTTSFLSLRQRCSCFTGVSLPNNTKHTSCGVWFVFQCVFPQNVLLHSQNIFFF